LATQEIIVFEARFIKLSVHYDIFSFCRNTKEQLLNASVKLHPIKQLSFLFATDRTQF